MTDREYAWTDRGRASAAANGVSFAEVIEALYSDNPLINPFGNQLMVCGRASTGRLVTVRCVRMATELAVFLITGARPANPAETEMYRRDAR